MQYLIKKGKKYFPGKCLIILVIIFIIIFSGLLISCRLKNSEEPGLIDNVSLSGSGSTYSFDGDKIMLKYENDKTSAVIDLLDTDKYYRGPDYTGVYISDEITAIAYSKNNGTGIMISYDRGKTWEKQTLDQTKTHQKVYLDKKIGFITKDDGWLVAGGDAGLGSQYHYIYETADGGKTWNEIGNANNVYAKMLTGAGFADENIGFLCFIRTDSSIAPTIYRTGDKGTTWEKLDIPVPEKYLSETENITVQIEAFSPVFHGADGVLPVEIDLFDGYDQASATSALYRTSDYGKTWSYDISTEIPIDMASAPDIS